MAAAARLLARISRQGVASAAAARRQAEAAALLGASAGRHLAPPCSSIKVGVGVSIPSSESDGAMCVCVSSCFFFEGLSRRGVANLGARLGF